MKFIAKRIFAFVTAVVVMMSTITVLNVSKVSAEESREYNIKVNLGTNCTTVYKDGKAIKAFICSPSSETPVGTFYTPIKYEWHEMIGNCYAQYCTRITGQVLFHSVWYYKKYDKSTMSVSAYNVMGQKASHGCVRLLCKDAKWIYDNCALNTRVDIFWGDKKDDPIPRPDFMPITNGAFTAWDPTDPDPANPWNDAKPSITQTIKKIEYKSKTDLLNTVEIKDSLGNKLTKKNASIKIYGKVNTRKLGTYKVTFDVTDKLKNNKEVTYTYKVVDTKQPIIKGTRNLSGIPVGYKVNLKKKVSAKTVTGKNLTKRIKITVLNSKYKKIAVKNGYVTFKKPGKYTVKYKVKGPNGRTLTKNVKYNVIDKKVHPQLMAKQVTVEYDSEFIPYSYVASLKSFKGVKLGIHERNIKVLGTVDTKVPGTYVVKYNFSNNGDKYSVVEKQLTVIVKDKPQEQPDINQDDSTENGEQTPEVTP